MKRSRYRTRIGVLALALAALATAAGTALAQTPVGTAFTYQGLLSDGASPASGVYDFEFRLFDALVGGTQVGSPVVVDNLGVVSGQFTIKLDFGATAFAGSARFLQISIRPGASVGAYTALSSRQELTPGPNSLFATKAASATTLNSLSCANTEVPKWNAGAWTCAADAIGTGDITGVTAGTGLTGGGASGPVTLAVDPAVVSQVGHTHTGTYLRLAGGDVVTGKLVTSSNDGVVLGGTFGSGTIPATGPGARLMWYPKKGAFRVGQVSGTNWDDANVGQHSMGLGPEALATGAATVVIGAYSEATGDAAIAIGDYARAQDFAGIAIGENVYAVGVGGIAIGAESRSVGELSVALGVSSYADGVRSVSIGGGYSGGDSSFTLGKQAQTRHKDTVGDSDGDQGTFVWADSQAAGFVSSGANQFLVRAAGGVGINKNNPAAALDVAGTAITTGLTVNGGFAVNRTGTSSVFDGVANETGGAWLNLQNSSASGKRFNLISTGTGNSEGAGKLLLRAETDSRVVMTLDGATAAWVGIGTSTRTANRMIETASGAYLSTGGTWTNSSDRNLKENLIPVDGRDVLGRIASLPLYRWNYRAESPAIAHVGPTAQDFEATFGLGGDGKSISTIDPAGLALAAIQELGRTMATLEAKSRALEAKTSEVDELKERLARLEAAVAGMGPKNR